MVQTKECTAGGPDNWGWKGLKAFPARWFDSLASGHPGVAHSYCTCFHGSACASVDVCGRCFVAFFNFEITVLSFAECWLLLACMRWTVPVFRSNIFEPFGFIHTSPFLGNCLSPALELVSCLFPCLLVWQHFRDAEWCPWKESDGARLCQCAGFGENEGEKGKSPFACSWLFEAPSLFSLMRGIGGPSSEHL